MTATVTMIPDMTLHRVFNPSASPARATATRLSTLPEPHVLDVCAPDEYNAPDINVDMAGHIRSSASQSRRPAEHGCSCIYSLLALTGTA